MEFRRQSNSPEARQNRFEVRLDRAIETQIQRMLTECTSFAELFSHIQGRQDFRQATLSIEVIRDPDVREKIEALLRVAEVEIETQDKREAEITRWRIDRFREFLAYCDAQMLEPAQEEAVQRRWGERHSIIEANVDKLRLGELRGMALLACIADSQFEDVWRERVVWTAYQAYMQGNGPVAKQLQALYDRIGRDNLVEQDAAA